MVSACESGSNWSRASLGQVTSDAGCVLLCKCVVSATWLHTSPKKPGAHVHWNAVAGVSVGMGVPALLFKSASSSSPESSSCPFPFSARLHEPLTHGFGWQGSTSMSVLVFVFVLVVEIAVGVVVVAVV